MTPPRLWAFGLLAAVLSGAGLPIYLFAPKVYAETYGLSLGTLGAVLFALRLVDVVQDPALGWLAERLGRWRPLAATLAAGLLGGAMLALFALPPLLPPLWWFALVLVVLFSAYSFLTILFYAQGVGTAAGLAGGHLRLAAWRESGALIGVCVASVAPVALGAVMGRPFAGFAWGFAVLALAAGLVMRGEWRPAPVSPPVALGTILRDRLARRLLILALLNAMPLAVTSTLFLFYVESVLASPGAEGPLLLLFFVSAAAAAPLWSRAARRFGVRPVLAGAMALAVLAFVTVLRLGAGDVWPFALVCVVSGAAIGADLVLLPALFARRMGQIAPRAAQGFGLWAFANKAALALAAVSLLPALDQAGFVAGGSSAPGALTLMVFLYAGLPSGLKLISIALVLGTRLEE